VRAINVSAYVAIALSVLSGRVGYAFGMNNVKTAALLGFLGALFVGVGYLLGGTGGGAVALGFAVIFNFAMYFFSDKIALKAARARPVEALEMPDLYGIVSSLAQRENMPMPSLHIIDSAQPNAFATGRSPKHAAVAVTTGILETLDRRELEGVLAHEMAHVKNRDILIATIAATIAAALSFLARMAFWGGLGGRRRNDNGISMIIGLVAMILAPIAAAVIQMAISRSREFEADHDGAESTGSPLALASALEKISVGASRIPMDVNPAVSQLFIADPLKAFGSGGRRRLGKMFATHPPVEERIDRLHKMASPFN
jgi:heat shock protein HtpX